jgi:peptidoglycan/LPS O-acetylase OafA/YrhL
VASATLAGLRKACLIVLMIAPASRVLLVATLGPESMSAWVMTPARLDGLALGGLMAVLARERGSFGALERWARPTAIWGIAAFLAIVLVERAAGTQEGALYQVLGLAASAYTAAAIVILTLGANRRSIPARAFSHGPLVAVGRYSYAAYVLHVPLLYVLNITGVLPRPTWEAGLASELSYIATMVALTILIAGLSWHGFEKHALRLRAPSRSPITR